MIKIHADRRLVFSTVSILLLNIFSPFPAQAIRNQDMSGDDTGAIAVYTFDNGIEDSAANPLNLNMSVDGNLPTAQGETILTNASIQPNPNNSSDKYLLINPKPNGTPEADRGYESAQRHRTFLVSSGPATKLNSCTNGFTIQAFVRPWFPFQGSTVGNLIVGLSNSEGQSSVVNPNFGLYQTGQSGAESATLTVRTGNTSSSSITSEQNGFYSVRQDANPGKVTEIIATQEPSGILTIYVNRQARSSLVAASPVFSPNAKLVIGNELVPLTIRGDGMTEIGQQRNWSGEIYHLAIYCRGFTRAELGQGTDYKSRAAVVTPQTGSIIKDSRILARKLVERLTGVIAPIDHPLVVRVEAKVVANDLSGAVKIITGDAASEESGHPEFLNTMVKQFALRMSTREETIRTPFNDFAASFIGVTRDEINAQELLTGNFFYMGNPALVKVRTDMFNDLLLSNNHYEDLEKGHWDIGKVLMKVPSAANPPGYPNGQQIAVDINGGMTASPDPAGVLTSRAFMAAHAIAGTNRRLVEYSFREFSCLPISQIADTAASPARIGRDIDRLPGADQTKFETSCKGCHTIMDGFRGAFAKYDFASVTINNVPYAFTRNTQVSRTPAAFGFPTTAVDQYGTVKKMNGNETVFPNGYTIIDDSFVNNATGANNRKVFGWNGPNKLGGVGVNQFGRMIADSDRFAECMANRVYESVCTPEAKPSTVVLPFISEIATKFKNSGYKLRTLFQDVAVHPVCIQNMGR